MKRALVVVLLLGLAVAPLAASGDVEAQAGGSTATNNSTVEQLRERVQELENENAELKTKVVSKNSRIQKLEFQLDQEKTRSSFSGAEASRLKSIGAWNPYEDQPAFLIWIESEDGGLYQFVGPGNGQHSFNGMSAWTRVLGGDAKLLGNITVDLHYAPKGIDETQVYRSTNALPKIRQLVNDMNQPKTRVAWERWNNERRHSAETQEKGTMGIVGGAMFALVLGAMYVESSRGLVNSWRQRRMRKKRTKAMLRSSESQIVSFLLAIPMIGRIVAWYIRWRHDR